MVDTEEYTVRFKKYRGVTDPRLGRHVQHDSRSKRYLQHAVDRATLVSKRHTSLIPTLDQGNLGSCTGNASTKNLSYEPFWDGTVADLPGPTGVAAASGTAAAAVGTVLWASSVLSKTDAAADEKYAIGVYSDATKLDPYTGTYPPTDTGSDGVSVAKVLQSRGLISGYKHATTFDAVLTALQTQAVIIGIDWYENMFNPASDGRITVSGSLAGGHELVMDEIDVENQRVWVQNSWGDSWGVNGRAYFTWSDFEKKIFNRDADVTIFVANSQPAPTPVPPTPTPVPPTPSPVIPPEDQRLIAVQEPWSEERHVRENKKAADAFKAWLKDKGYDV